MPLLELRDVSARYGPIAALHGLSLQVEEGTIVAILGANGAGKTTTLRAISGLVRKSGEIVFAGRRIGGWAAERTARSGIAHVPEGRGILRELTVWENLRMGAYKRRGRAAVQAELQRMQDFFPWLADLRDPHDPPPNRRERQRLAHAPALAALALPPL